MSEGKFMQLLILLLALLGGKPSDLNTLAPLLSELCAQDATAQQPQPPQFPLKPILPIADEGTIYCLCRCLCEG
jgi:hypothetical protein